MKASTKLKFWDILIDIALIPMLVLWHGLAAWDKYILGYEHKTGRHRMKYKVDLIVGTRYSKRKGLKYIFTKWKPVSTFNHFTDLDIINYYPDTRIKTKLD
jgi:hypothetical protein